MWYRLAIVGSDMPPGGNSSVRPQHSAANRDYLAISRMSIVGPRSSRMTQDFFDGMLVAILPSMIAAAWLARRTTDWPTHASDMALFAILQIAISISLTIPYPKKHIQAAESAKPKTITA